MPLGISVRDVAQVRTERISGSVRMGSGYRVTDDAVLTAAHVLDDAARVSLRFEAGTPDDRVEQATSWVGIGRDMALVRFTAPTGAHAHVDPPTYGRFGPHPVVCRAVAAGYPRHALKKGADGRKFRDLDQADGDIATLTGRRSGTLTFNFPTRQDFRDTPADESPWGGMSGAAVWVQDCLVGVITRDPDLPHSTALTAERIEVLLDDGRDTSNTVRRSLGLTANYVLRDVAIAPQHHRVLESHRRQTREKLPVGGIRDRDTEVNQMIEFCSSPKMYFTWHAGAWSGKTALMRAFVADPPHGLDVVSFFVNSQDATARDSRDFLRSISRQLEAVIAAAEMTSSTPGAEPGDFYGLLDNAAATSRRNQRRLVMVIDGLDEDIALTSTGVDQPSIASLLPKIPIDGLSIIVATRPYERVLAEVDDDHPFRSKPPHILSRSPHATEVARVASQEIVKALGGGVGDDLHVRDLIGFLAAAGSGLTAVNLAELTRITTVVAVEQCIAHDFRRSITVLEEAGGGWHEDRTPVFGFAHTTLPGRVRAGFVAAEYERRYVEPLHQWVEAFRNRRWPDDTPVYLATGYPDLLLAQADLCRLANFALDPDRHAWLLTVLGGDGQSIKEIREAEKLNIDTTSTPPDLVLAVRLAVARETLSSRNRNPPNGALGLLARIGSTRKAFGIATALTDPRKQAEALASIAAAQAAAGHRDDARKALDEALSTAATITNPWPKARALASIAAAQAAAGHFDDATATATTITDAAEKARALASLTASQARARHFDDARATAATITAATLRAEAMMSIAAAEAGAGDFHARATAAAITSSSEKVQALAAIVTAETATGRFDDARTTLDQARATAATIADAWARAEVLAAVATAQIAAGHLDDARATLDQALAIAATDPQRQAEVLTAVATAQAAAGHSADARATLDAARAAAATITDPQRRAEVLTAVATAQIAAGHSADARATLDQALAIAATDPQRRAKVLTAVATVSLATIMGPFELSFATVMGPPGCQ